MAKKKVKASKAKASKAKASKGKASQSTGRPSEQRVTAEAVVHFVTWLQELDLVEEFLEVAGSRILSMRRPSFNVIKKFVNQHREFPDDGGAAGTLAARRGAPRPLRGPNPCPCGGGFGGLE